MKHRRRPAKILLAPKRAGTGAVHANERRNVIGYEHSVDDAALKMGARRKVFVHVQRIAVAAQLCERFEVFRG